MAQVAVVGAGPAGLMAATALAEAGVSVEIYDAMPSPGRKFLLAGRGGMNLTHSEPLPAFASRYGKDAAYFAAALARFDNQATRDFAASLGIETFIGTSGRVFPTDFKAAPLLRAWLRKLRASGVTLHARHRWSGFDGPTLLFDHEGETVRVAADAVVLALGGASWPHLGSDGAWVPMLAQADVSVAPLKPSNCGFEIAWSPLLAERHAGQPVKPVAVSFGERTVRGEVMLTAYGIEGTPIYALSGALRDAIEQSGEAMLHLDLKPDLDQSEVSRRLSAPARGQSLSSQLKKVLGLSPAAIALLHEGGKPQLGPQLAERIKHLPLRLERPRPIAEAISSAGGVRFDSLDEHQMLRPLPGVFVAGEMMDWEAPTGGYLLQGCFATAVRAADGVKAWLDQGNRLAAGKPDQLQYPRARRWLFVQTPPLRL